VVSGARLPLALPRGVPLPGKPNQIFAELTEGSGKMGFDGFAHWALKASLDYVAPEEEPAPGALSAVKNEKVRNAMLQQKKEKAAREKAEMEREMEELKKEAEMMEKMQRDIEALTAKNEAALQSSKDGLKGKSPQKSGGGLW
jgi:hypothetical protein